MHLGMAECRVTPWDTLTSDLVSRLCIVSGAYLLYSLSKKKQIWYECILGWWSVVYHLCVALTLTTALVFRIIMSGAYLLYSLSYEFQIWCVYGSVAYYFLVAVTLTSDLVYRIIVPEHILYHLS